MSMAQGRLFSGEYQSACSMRRERKKDTGKINTKWMKQIACVHPENNTSGSACIRRPRVWKRDSNICLWQYIWRLELSVERPSIGQVRQAVSHQLPYPTSIPNSRSCPAVSAVVIHICVCVSGMVAHTMTPFKNSVQ